MWIRSQDKLDLINCTRFTVSNNTISTEIEMPTPTKWWEIGKYKSKKRCIEVLDGINEKLDYQTPFGTIKFPPQVYQMPSK